MLHNSPKSMESYILYIKIILDSVFIRENAGQWKPIYSDILYSACNMQVLNDKKKYFEAESWSKNKNTRPQYSYIKNVCIM